MPRLTPRILHQARKVDPLLPLVLQGTRDLASAKNELRWLKEYVLEQQQNKQGLGSYSIQQQLRKLCVDRARGKPLQYIMGTEYFGDLEIACKPGVLIPRQETAASVTFLIARLLQGKNPPHLPNHLRILDLCTGTGCIPLLAHYELGQKRRHSQPPQSLEVVGVDISNQALNLANRNLHQLIGAGYLGANPLLHFLQADILATDSNDKSNHALSLDSALHQYESTSSTSRNGRWDILISNPPYISPQAFNDTTQRSVKRYEPRLALVPPPQNNSSSSKVDQGDIFYPRLLQIAQQVGAKIVLFEVADSEQAQRVALLAKNQGIWDGIEIWRDYPSEHDPDAEIGNTSAFSDVKLLGTGNGRSVFAYRGDARDWLCKE
ncbi:modification methylase HemK, partial [Aureobasidium melanogenum]